MTDITVVDVFDNRLEVAKELGATHVINASQVDTVEAAKELTGGAGYELVYETAGSKFTTAQTPYIVKAGGVIVVVGNVHDPVTYDFMEVNGKEVDIMTTFRYRNIYPMAINAIAGGKIDVKKVATNFMKFEDIQEAFEVAYKQKQTALKVVVEMPENEE